MRFKLIPKQRTVAYRFFKQDGGAAWWKVGLGKTRLCLRVFALNAKRSGCPGRYLVVGRRAAFEDWVEEFHKCKMQSHFSIKLIERVDDISSLQGMSQILYLSSGMIVKFVESLGEMDFDWVCLDEGYLYKNPMTDRSRAAQVLTAPTSAMLLSGNLMTARNLEDVWGQLLAINKHEPIARTLTIFRSRFMIEYAIGDPDAPTARTYVPRFGAARRLGQQLRRGNSIWFPSQNQRRRVIRTFPIDPSPMQQTMMQELREYWGLQSHHIQVKNRMNLITKVQMISDGFIESPSGRSTSVPSAKLDWLIHKVTEILEGGDLLVVWCAFRRTVDLLLHALQKAVPELDETNCVSMMSGKSFDLAAWRRSGRVCIATEASGSAVNRFDQCAYGVYYSCSPAWVHLEQSMGRHDRRSSKHRTCFYFIPYTRGSIDLAVYHRAVGSGRQEDKLKFLNTWLQKTAS